MKQSECPKCKAALPRRGQFCLECGLDLYAEGLRRKPIPWLQVLLVAAIAGGVLAVLVIGPGKPQAAPEVEAVIARTRDLLRLLADRNYAAVVDGYFKTNSARFAEVEELLRESARGAGAQGLKNAQSHGFRDLNAALAYVRKHGTKHPDYIARLLYTIVSHPEPNPWLSPRRAERFFEWYLEQAFGAADVAKAQLDTADARWEEGRLTVKVRYPEPVAPPPGVEDPSVLHWRLVTGGWGGCTTQRLILEFGTDDHLGEFLDLLKRLPAE